MEVFDIVEGPSTSLNQYKISGLLFFSRWHNEEKRYSIITAPSVIQINRIVAWDPGWKHLSLIICLGGIYLFVLGGGRPTKTVLQAQKFRCIRKGKGMLKRMCRSFPNNHVFKLLLYLFGSVIERKYSICVCKYERWS